MVSSVPTGGMATCWTSDIAGGRFLGADDEPGACANVATAAMKMIASANAMGLGLMSFAPL